MEIDIHEVKMITVERRIKEVFVSQKDRPGKWSWFQLPMSPKGITDLDAEELPYLLKDVPWSKLTIVFKPKNK